MGQCSLFRMHLKEREAQFYNGPFWCQILSGSYVSFNKTDSGHRQSGVKLTIQSRNIFHISRIRPTDLVRKHKHSSISLSVIVNVGESCYEIWTFSRTAKYKISRIKNISPQFSLLAFLAPCFSRTQTASCLTLIERPCQQPPNYKIRSLINTF